MRVLCLLWCFWVFSSEASIDIIDAIVPRLLSIKRDAKDIGTIFQSDNKSNNDKNWPYRKRYKQKNQSELPSTPQSAQGTIKFLPTIINQSGSIIAGYRECDLYFAGINGENPWKIRVDGKILTATFATSERVVYTYQSRNGLVRLMMIDLRSKTQRDLTPVKNTRRIVLTVWQNTVFTTSFNGNEYSCHIVVFAHDPTCRLIKKGNTPFTVFPSTNSILYCKNGTLTIVDNDTDTEKLVGSMDPRCEKIISAEGTGYWKIRTYDEKVEVIFVNWRTGGQQSTIMQGRFGLNDIKIFLDRNGRPWVVSAVNKDGRVAYAPFDKEASRHLHHISQIFGSSSSWEIIGATADKNIWILHVYDNRKSNDIYILYDIRNGHTKHLELEIVRNSSRKINFQ